MLVTGIGSLVTNDPDLGRGPLGIISDAALVTDGTSIAWVGARSEVPEGVDGPALDVAGRCVVPGFVDAHTHLVFAGHRSAEFAARLAGEPYDGGGIRQTVAATRSADTATLTEVSRRRARQALTSGTTTMEVKSGYGLTVDDERRLLEIAGALDGDGPTIVPTFLGAHVVPEEYAGARWEYVSLVAGEMLDACAPLAQWCDVFCERTVFDRDDARTVLTAAKQRGLGLRLHANQLEHGEGAQLAAELGAASADHLTHVDDADVGALADAGVVATLLPAAEFSTGSPYAPARRLLDAGATIALATDCNPGTSYTTSMPFVIALACREMGLTPDEALHAATVGGAASLHLPEAGRFRAGAPADIVVLDAPDHIHLAYRPGMNLVDAVVSRGTLVGASHG